ncbi:MAG TPA: leucine--tRNA ligase [Pyrinomonadaceae bacterium]|nr:leucine--tRNA ligase [Pyrinomonadaceae bacterium]
MDERYFAEKIEEKWQARWVEARAFEADADPSREKRFYCLEMLPYPSGFLHMGHVRNYSIGDALAWFRRLQGFNVLHPIGWDSFGQPAEQAAIKRGVMPLDWTEQNIAHMRGQMRRLGIGYDWRREVAAHRPEYYRWDQWFFLKLMERGLTYKKVSPVNWCPQEGTVLSNEQSSGGVCWRCGAEVEKRDIEQWFVRITDYADQLLDDMAQIERGWPERVLTMQRNWIGKSSGAYIDFQIKDTDERVRVFTTRIDTVYGATAVVLAADHPLVRLSPLREDVAAFAERVRRERAAASRAHGEEEEEKEGINTGLLAVNPFSGELIPVWAANYVLLEYGTGAVMSVPAHDERDFEFAQRYSLPVRRVIERISHDQPQIDHDPESEDQSVAMDRAFTEQGILVNSDRWSGKLSEDAKREMAEHARAEGFGEPATTYRLRDWGISRQRFWGAPIPVVYCDSCGAVPVPEGDLPVLLPERAEFTGTGRSPLAAVEEFVNTACPKCAGAARRETDTMDTFVDSCWYYFRYCDPQNDRAPFDPEMAAYWTPVDQYIGGVEHAVMHLLYTRFWAKFMRDIGLVRFDEPVRNLTTQGMVVAEVFYRDADEGRAYFNPTEVEVERDEKGRVVSARLASDGEPVMVGPFEKMSKSKNNGVDPDEMVAAYGADAVRLFTLFAAPVENDLRWQEAGIDGALRFLRRVHSTVGRWRSALVAPPAGPAAAGEFSEAARRLRHETHRAIARVTADFEGLRFNTAIAALMELSNAVGDFGAAPEATTPSDLFAVREALEALTLMLAPISPHVAEEMWEGLGHPGGMLAGGAFWPAADGQLARRDELEIPVQVNGKLRGRVLMGADATEEEMRAGALAEERVRAWIEGKEVVKVVVVPKRLVNIVVR